MGPLEALYLLQTSPCFAAVKDEVKRWPVRLPVEIPVDELQVWAEREQGKKFWTVFGLLGL